MLDALMVVMVAVMAVWSSPEADAQACDACMGDIAGIISNTGAETPDGIVNEFDIIELIRITDNSTFNPCADMDFNGVLTLGPVDIGGVTYPGDLDLMFAAFGVCNTTCQDAEGNPALPCEREHLGVGCNNPDCCGLICNLEPYCCNTTWDAFCAETAREICSSEPGSCLLPNIAPGCLDSECQDLVCTWDRDNDGVADYEYCCDLAWDRYCVEAAGIVCLDVFCEPYLGNCAQPRTTPGCQYPSCSNAVCEIRPECCKVAWDQSCVDLAFTLDDCPCALQSCGDQFNGSCTLEHSGKGCDEAACCALVCLVDPYCCEINWDLNCALAATETCPTDFGVCGRFNGTPCNSVVPPFQPGCNDFACCNAVCEVDPYCCAAEWDVNCALLTYEVCSSYDICGELGTGSCRVVHETPGCDDGGCCSEVCNFYSYCCEVEWDVTCVGLANFLCNGCGDLGAGSCFNENNQTAACNDENCCNSVCVIDAFCCSDQWDSLCVSLAENYCFDPLNYCGSALTRSCFIPSITQGCDDTACCEAICRSFDPFCCEVNWDAICVTTAFALDDCAISSPTGGRGDCLEPHTLPGCAIASCSAAVCEIKPECCEISWSHWCAEAAKELCFDLVICPGEGSCTTTNSTPGCEDPWCCNIVCNLDPACCNQQWDNSCVVLAFNNCDGAALANCPCSGACFEAHENPGCETESCCTAVCTHDGDGDLKPDHPECCEIAWDETCAELATQICCTGSLCGDLCAGSCLDSNGTPNCDDPACCDAVCEIDPYCCTVTWDGRCATLAAERCNHGCGVPSSGSCFVAKATPGCADSECCASICQDIDPYCCEVTWDITCTEQALLECDLPECGDFSTGDCCLIHDGPGCNDRRCCDDVCDTDPFCCESNWDNVCLGIARLSDECECSYECGDVCAGSCCEANGTPSCSDEDCCDVVCALDPFCCDSEWDLYCAQAAISNCNDKDEACPAPECGDPVAGGCCFGNGSPSCDVETCCDAICDDDPYCCEVEWDEECAIAARSDEYKDECPCSGGLDCGDPDTGSCDEANDTPYCDNLECCETICVVDPACCSVEWDESCAGLASIFCDL